MRRDALSLVLIAATVNQCLGKGFPAADEVVSRCYDCDYGPEDGVQSNSDNLSSSKWKKGKASGSANDAGSSSSSSSSTPGAGGAAGDTRRGFPQCALDQATGQESLVREIVCQSAVCFIRKDHNGLVYRGCADSRNLPLDVSTSAQCESQGVPRPAVWWFCNGTLCNSGRFGSGDVCAPSTQPAAAAAAADLPPSHGPAKSSKKPKSRQPEVNPVLSDIPSHQHAAVHGPPMSSAGPSLSSSGATGQGRTFEEIQRQSGYANAGQPVVYGGTGLTSDQAFQVYMANHNNHSSQSQQQQPAAGAASASDPSTASAAFSKKGEQPEMPAIEAMEVMPAVDPKFDGFPVKSFQAFEVQPPPQVSVVVYAGKKEKYQAPPALPSAPAMDKAKSYAKPKMDPPTTTSTTTTTTTTTTTPVPPTEAPHVHKTWDFMLLAKSRLQQLSHEQHNNNNNKKFSGKFEPPMFASDQQQESGMQNGKGVTDWAGKSFDPMMSGKSVSAAGNQDLGAPSQRLDDVMIGSGSGGELSSYNPCDNTCDDNPSGLFPDESGVDSFIQCGPGMDPASGVACHCCRPYRMHCPPSTSFDHVTKVCSGGRDEQQQQP